MLALRLLEEGTHSGPDVSGLVWIVLIIFVLMVFLGWLAASKGWLKPEEEPVQAHGHGHEEHGHAEPAHAEVINHEEHYISGSMADDLVSLEGIGPKVAKLLEGIGITTFKALAESDKDKVQEALNAAGYKYMDPTGWIEQAKFAAAGDQEGLAKLQSELKGGRKA